ncbi:MAG: hypothetical protein HY547_04340 [Elusimicrobia bacterium]|nr:hypothetical protein [Elusimicrobiota bacterium]
MSPKTGNLLKEIDRLARPEKEKIFHHLEVEMFRARDKKLKERIERLCQEGQRLAKRHGWREPDLERLVARAKERSP